jgi:hypothetical protein
MVSVIIRQFRTIWLGSRSRAWEDSTNEHKAESAPFRQSQTPVCGAPACRSGTGAGLIFLSFAGTELPPPEIPVNVLIRTLKSVERKRGGPL